MLYLCSCFQSRSLRRKLLSYLSAESIRQSSLSFDIPFDRQQLADFLCVERAAMSAELSKLQTEGLPITGRNHFELLTTDSPAHCLQALASLRKPVLFCSCTFTGRLLYL